MVTVAARAHRTLRRRQRADGSWQGLERFHDARDEPRVSALYPDPANEGVVGYYQNDEGIDPQVVVVTSRGLRFPGTTVEPVDFDQITALDGPPDKLVGPRELTLQMTDGTARVLQISGRAGPDGRFPDLYEFMRFLIGVVRDARRNV